MRKKTKLLSVILCLTLFAMMALGSTSSSNDDKKGIVGGGSDKSDVTIEEQELVNDNGIVITAKEYVSDSIFGDGIKLLLENNTDNTVRVGCTALIVNNYMITDLFAKEVAPGKKANEVMYLSSSALKAAGIDSVGQVEIYFHIYDSSSFDKIFDSDCVTIKTSAFDQMDTTPNDTGTELYNANGIKIVGKAVDEKSFWGKTILLYCENTSGKNVGVSVEEMSINGFMVNPIYSNIIYDGKMSIDDVTILKSELEENGITEIKDVELKFHIFDAKTYSTIEDSGVISFSAK